MKCVDLMRSKITQPTSHVLLFPLHCPPKLVQLCHSCWAEPEQRPTMADLLTQLSCLCRELAPGKAISLPETDLGATWTSHGREHLHTAPILPPGAAPHGHIAAPPGVHSAACSAKAMPGVGHAANGNSGQCTASWQDQQRVSQSQCAQAARCRAASEPNKGDASSLTTVEGLEATATHTAQHQPPQLMPGVWRAKALSNPLLAMHGTLPTALLAPTPPAGTHADGQTLHQGATAAVTDSVGRRSTSNRASVGAHVHTSTSSNTLPAQQQHGGAAAQGTCAGLGSSRQPGKAANTLLDTSSCHTIQKDGAEEGRLPPKGRGASRRSSGTSSTTTTTTTTTKIGLLEGLRAGFRRVTSSDSLRSLLKPRSQHKSPPAAHSTTHHATLPHALPQTSHTSSSSSQRPRSHCQSADPSLHAAHAANFTPAAHTAHPLITPASLPPISPTLCQPPHQSSGSKACSDPTFTPASPPQAQAHCSSLPQQPPAKPTAAAAAAAAVAAASPATKALCSTSLPQSPSTPKASAVAAASGAAAPTATKVPCDISLPQPPPATPTAVAAAAVAASSPATMTSCSTSLPQQSPAMPTVAAAAAAATAGAAAAATLTAPCSNAPPPGPPRSTKKALFQSPKHGQHTTPPSRVQPPASHSKLSQAPAHLSIETQLHNINTMDMAYPGTPSPCAPWRPCSTAVTRVSQSPTKHTCAVTGAAAQTAATSTCAQPWRPCSTAATHPTLSPTKHMLANSTGTATEASPASDAAATAAARSPGAHTTLSSMVHGQQAQQQQQQMAKSSISSPQQPSTPTAPKSQAKHHRASSYSASPGCPSVTAAPFLSPNVHKPSLTQGAHQAPPALSRSFRLARSGGDFAPPAALIQQILAGACDSSAWCHPCAPLTSPACLDQQQQQLPTQKSAPLGTPANANLALQDASMACGTQANADLALQDGNTTAAAPATSHAHVTEWGVKPIRAPQPRSLPSSTSQQFFKSAGSMAGSGLAPQAQSGCAAHLPVHKPAIDAKQQQQQQQQQPFQPQQCPRRPTRTLSVGAQAQLALACGVVPHFATFDEAVPDETVLKFLDELPPIVSCNEPFKVVPLSPIQERRS
ncbi:hypothetical protein DUNSADRAFT_14519 [Dunaliella salina]|uniref:Serine-threonine/tyrosine-protein kinase catalytic domain-containing protein n=1 Tax=Dunaliella salina TaxID=3046 RepID=A0ABQ7G7C2_DUNSA|nr:hypothetical protein DUNSADRAFT_14519 [Dunaliella salina]|eukprot:KAF5830493.1 hypothetical protein DUNSADRAFT_14519 [Dunaliella salina]